ncbi:hypothetical protein OROHE_020525 [Orobanche hederae]
MEGAVMAGAQDLQQPPPARVVERLNPAVQQQLNLESVRTRAISLFKAISRILEEFNAIAAKNAAPKWQDILGQFSMVNLELYNIVEDLKNVSKAFVVHPKNVNAENAIILPVMLSSKLLPEMEMGDNTKREQLLHGMQNLPVSAQIEKLKIRIDMIGAACESAEKIIADARKAYFGTQHGPTHLPTIDKVQAAKIQKQENLLRSAVNHGEGMYQKSTPPLLSAASNNNQGSLLQTSGAQLIGRAAASPSGANGSIPIDNTTASPIEDANSPRSGANIMNTPSPQQQQQQPQPQQHLHQQRQKMMQLPPHQQLLSQQQLRPSWMPSLGQMHNQNHPQFSQPLAAQQLQGRQLTSAAMHMSQNQLNQGNQLNRQLNQFSSPANSALFNAAQTTPTSQMITNMSAMMSSQSVLPRMQYGISGGNRTLPPQNLSDQMLNMGAGTAGGGMMPIQQQTGAAFGNMSQQSGQNLQPNTAQTHPNFQQQRQNQQ